MLNAANLKLFDHLKITQNPFVLSLSHKGISFGASKDMPLKWSRAVHVSTSSTRTEKVDGTHGKLLSAVSASPTLQLPHDIILPEAIGAWPLAYGWWLLIGLCFVSVAVLLWFVWQRRRAQAPHHAALAQLNIINQQQDDRRFLSDCAVWLKRQAIVFHGREQAAALNGEAWLKFLDETGDTQAFSQGPGRALLTLYQPKLALQRDDLNTLLQTWLNQQFEAQRKGNKHRV